MLRIAVRAGPTKLLAQRLFSLKNAPKPSWESFGFKKLTKKSLESAFDAPTDMQTKVFSRAQKNQSAMAFSWPGTGKKTAALTLALDSAAELDGSEDPNQIQNLLLVASEEEALDMARIAGILSPDFPGGIGLLYRCGGKDKRYEDDNAQHLSLLKDRPRTLIATPTRLMDYMEFEPEELNLEFVKTISVLNLEHMQSHGADKPTNVELLLDVLLGISQVNPRLLLTSDFMGRRLKFLKMGELLQNHAHLHDIAQLYARPERPVNVKLKLLDHSADEVDFETFAKHALNGPPAYERSCATLLFDIQARLGSVHDVVTIPYLSARKIYKELIAFGPTSQSIAEAQIISAAQLESPSKLRDTTSLLIMAPPSEYIFLPEIARRMVDSPDSIIYIAPFGYTEKSLNQLREDIALLEENVAVLTDINKATEHQN